MNNIFFLLLLKVRCTSITCPSLNSKESDREGEICETTIDEGTETEDWKSEEQDKAEPNTNSLEAFKSISSLNAISPSALHLMESARRSIKIRKHVSLSLLLDPTHHCFLQN